jgi:hypothetical protein
MYACYTYIADRTDVCDDSTQKTYDGTNAASGRL